jgi:hypothetical protein
MDISSFHRKYQGKRAFLIGNGPSLARTPLDQLQGEHTFAMNRIALLYDKVNWRPSFFVCTTTNVARAEWRKDILRTISLGIPSFVLDELKGYVEPHSNVIYINCTHGNEVVSYAPDEWWSYDVSQRVCKFGSSMLVALQIAVYMGFNPIYLIGCDLGFRRPSSKLSSNRLISKALRRLTGQQSILARDPNHFDPGYGTPGLAPEKLDMNMLAAHNLALRATKQIGVQIYNATLGGELEVYPRVELAHVFGEAIQGGQTYA